MIRRLFICALIFSSVIFSRATSPAENLADLSFDDNIETPAVPKKAAAPIVRHMDNIRATISKHGLNVGTDRNGQVAVVTIPCSQLFAPNDTALLVSGEKYLRPFGKLLKYPTMYKVIVAVHSDNTGEPAYLDDLTSARADAVDYFITKISGTDGSSLVPYGLGCDVPLNDNASISERDANRRLEIYIVPNTGMIETARAGKLQ